MKLPSASSTRNHSCILQEEAEEALKFQRNLHCNPHKKERKKKDTPFLTKQTKKDLLQTSDSEKKQISNKKRRKT
jgi:hypothetical protein